MAIDDLFVMAPLSKYDLYFMGRSVYSSVKVAASQTNEDAKEEECQTEDVSAWRIYDIHASHISCFSNSTVCGLTEGVHSEQAPKLLL